MQNKYIGGLLISASAYLFCTCTEVKLNPGENSKATQEPQPAEDERVDPPSNIAGQYLICAAESQPTDDRPESTVGCRFEDANGSKVALESVAAQAQFSYQTPEDKQLIVQVKALSGDPRYDAAYLIIGVDKARALNGYKALEVYVDLTNVAQGGGNQAVGGRVADIEKDPAALPEARTTDYDAVRDQIFAEYQNGQFTPPINP